MASILTIPDRGDPASGASGFATHVTNWHSSNLLTWLDIPMITLSGVRKCFDTGRQSLTLFTGLDLTLDPARLHLLLGQSGSGKSTLLRLIAGLERPDAGTITLDEIRLDTLAADPMARLRGRHFGIVYQEYNLLPTLKVWENLALALEVNRLPVDQGAIMALLDRLGVATQADRFPDTLSGGQRQRVALARALIHRPRWILADEPTGSLDEANAAQVMGLLVAAVREQGCGLLLVSHNPAYGALADRVLHLEGGALHESRP